MNGPDVSLVRDRSASATVGVGSVLELLARLGSEVVGVTTAVLSTTWSSSLAPMPTTTLIGVASAPAASGLVASHVTVLATVPQFHPLPPLAESRFSGAGTVSVTTRGNWESLGRMLVSCSL